MPTLDYDEPKRQVAAIQQRLNAAVAEIRSNKSLTPQGKRRELAQATIAARRSADQVRQQHAAEREQQLAASRRIAFGNSAPLTGGAEALSARDAADRAAKLTSHAEAKVALSQAILLDDRPYAKAIAAHAHGRGWSDISDTYGHEYGVSSFIDDLNSIPSGPRTATADAIICRVAPPDELRGYNDHTLQQLVDAKVSE